MKTSSMNMNEFKIKFIEKCKKPASRILIFIFLICIVSVAYLFINRIKANYETSPNTFSIYEGEDVKLEVKYKLNGTVTYDVHNFTLEEVHTGTPYYIQKKSMGNWVNIRSGKSVGFTMEGHTIFSKESMEYSSDITTVYGNLPMGKYRIVKEVRITGRDVCIAGEFRIVLPGLKQQISKREAAQVVQRQIYDHIPNSDNRGFDNIIIKKVTYNGEQEFYNGKRVYKVTFQTKHGEWVESEVWYVDQGGLIVGNE